MVIFLALTVGRQATELALGVISQPVAATPVGFTASLLTLHHGSRELPKMGLRGRGSFQTRDALLL
jgi:hypothetical protein